MAEIQPYQADIQAVLSHRQANGADLWATPDGSLITGNPFTTLSCALYLLELGMPPDDPILQQVAALVFATWQPEGRFKVYPKGAIYPCQTAHVAQVLCHLGYADDERLTATFRHFLDTQHTDGGWRCNKFSFGRGPETEFSNPNATLLALDAFRFREDYRGHPALDRAVESLLSHWESRAPIGPCHYGIGTLFLQVEYPFRGYNLFQYVYTLSFYDKAREDSRFREALQTLESKLVDGQMVVERVVPKLAKLNFCRKGKPSEFATRRYHDILRNIGKK